MTHQKTGYPTDYAQVGTETAKDRLGSMADATTDKMKEVADSAQEMAGKVADQAMEYGGKAQDAAKQVRPFMEKSMKEQPGHARSHCGSRVCTGRTLEKIA